MTTECKCEKLKLIHGRAGQDYARAHLKELKIDQVKWQVLYQCPQTGIYWKEFMRHPEVQGGGISEFIQITKEEAQKEFNHVL